VALAAVPLQVVVLAVASSVLVAVPAWSSAWVADLWVPAAALSCARALSFSSQALLSQAFSSPAAVLAAVSVVVSV
jgi:hypothetical protein